jgi:hypothetical protein
VKKATFIILACSLIGARLQAGNNPVSHLPGMPASAAATGNLPQIVVSELTNYPNPFDSRKSGAKGQTAISYQLVQDAKVDFDIFDLFGHKVRSWQFVPGENGGRQGANTVVWDGTDGDGDKVAKGGYIASLTIETPQTTVTAIRKIGVIH